MIKDFDIKKKYGTKSGHEVIIRACLSGDHVKYPISGEVVGESTLVSWTINGLPSYQPRGENWELVEIPGEVAEVKEPAPESVGQWEELVRIDRDIVEFLDKEGYAIVRLGRIHPGEAHLIYTDGEYKVSKNDYSTYGIVLQKKYTPTCALHPGWIFSNDGMNWFHSAYEPIDTGKFYTTSAEPHLIDQRCINFTAPEWSGYKTSKYRI